MLGIFFRDQAHALKKRGLKVGIIIPEHRPIKLGIQRYIRRPPWKDRFQITSEIDKTIPVLRCHGTHLPLLPYLNNKIWTKQAVRLFKRYVIVYGYPDIIHVQSSIYAGIAAAKIKQLFNTPYIITEHSSLFSGHTLQKWRLSAIQKGFLQADKIVAVSHSLAEQIQPLVNKEKVGVIPNTINTDFFSLPPDSRTIKPFRILSIGSLIPIKSFDLLIKAFAITFRDVEDVRLEIGGDGQERRPLEKLAAKLNVSEQVTFLGQLSRKEVREAMWRANILVSASQKETFGITLIEALATGLPVIATRSGGPEDIITEDVGKLVDRNNEVQLASTLRKTFKKRSSLNDKEMLRRKYIQNTYSENVFARNFVRLCTNVLKRYKIEA